MSALLGGPTTVRLKPDTTSVRLKPDTTSSASPSHDAPEPDVAGGGVDRLRHPRGGAVAQAIVRRAQVRSALHHPPRDANLIARVDAAIAIAAARVVERTARPRDLPVLLVP